MRYATVITLFLVLTGCTQYMWKHPSHSDMARFRRDHYECERDMRQSGYYGGGIAGQMNATAFGERCMVARGYYKVAKDDSAAQ
jgi:hypothetical protein